MVCTNLDLKDPVLYIPFGKPLQRLAAVSTHFELSQHDFVYFDLSVSHAICLNVLNFVISDF